MFIYSARAIDLYNISLLSLLNSLLYCAGVATRQQTNNATGNVTSGNAASSASARYQPYTIQPTRLNRT